MFMRALGGLALVVGAVTKRVVDSDVLDDEDLVLDVNLAFRL